MWAAGNAGNLRGMRIAILLSGNMWGCETYGMRPDLLTCAKQLSSGYLPISAVVVGQHVYDAIADFSQKNGVFGHGYTYSGHPVSAAVALETIQIYEERDIVNSVRALSVPFVLIADKETKKAFHPSVKGAGGVVIPPATYWEKMQTVLEKYNVMLVSDEVITGFART
eukprot:gene17850-21256_t